MSLVTVSAAVEGIVDEAVVRRIAACVGARVTTVYGKNGKASLREKIEGYNNAARYSPWLVLVDLDQDADCAPPLRNAWLPEPAPYMCFRVAVREVEAWLMADAVSLARYLGVDRGKIPAHPEAVSHPKLEMVNLARASRKPAIRHDMVPRPDSRRSVGPAYSSRLVEYVQRYWRPRVAAQRADSLRRAIECLRRLVEGQR